MTSESIRETPPVEMWADDKYLLLLAAGVLPKSGGHTGRSPVKLGFMYPPSHWIWGFSLALAFSFPKEDSPFTGIGFLTSCFNLPFYFSFKGLCYDAFEQLWSLKLLSSLTFFLLV